jgi:hypothetical protein
MAAVRGAVDFREARPHDPAWRRRVRLLKHGVRAEIDAAVYTALYRTQLALVSNGRLTDESFAKAQEGMRACCEALRQTYRPWEPDAEGRKASQHADLRDAFVRLVGDPSDPVFMETQLRGLREMEEAAAAKVDGLAVLRERLARKR